MTETQQSSRKCRFRLLHLRFAVMYGATILMPNVPDTDSQNETEPMTYGVQITQANITMQSERSASACRPQSPAPSESSSIIAARHTETEASTMSANSSAVTAVPMKICRAEQRSRFSSRIISEPKKIRCKPETAVMCPMPVR